MYRDLLKTGSLDNAIEEFHWLSHHGRQTRDFWGVFILFHSRLLDMGLVI